MRDERIKRRYEDMKRYVGWTDEDAHRVSALRELVTPHAASLVSDFYAEVRRHPEAMRVITGGSEQMVRLSRTLRAWLVDLLAGNYDDDYMARRWKVGYRHVEIGLAQRYASLALARLRAGIVAAAEQEWRGESQELAQTLGSLHKLLDLENALIQDAYEFEHVRRERQMERDRSERRFRQLVESASCLIVILNPDHHVEYFNPHAEQVTGYAAIDLVRDRDRVLSLLGSDAEHVGQRLSNALEGESIKPYEDQIQVRSGPPRWINWTLSRIEDYDEGPAILAVGYDVTDAKLAAEQLLQASRLATIGEMYAGLAHESRNALQRLRACTDMLADHVSQQPAAAGLLERSQRAQEDLQQLFDEVRSFASPIILERTACRLPSLWREAWNLLQVQRRGRRAELVDDACDVQVTIEADRFRLVQTFRNIFENALAACPDPALIRVTCRETELNDVQAVEIALEDNGPGFSPAALQRAFEPFFTTKSTGTGLGLAIVRRIVEAHGGRVAVTGGQRGGARLSLTLPRQAAGVTAPADMPSAVSPRWEGSTP
jgi:PAS domain S-box-containing protein